jgi:hypothetical protein
MDTHAMVNHRYAYIIRAIIFVATDLLKAHKPVMMETLLVATGAVNFAKYKKAIPAMDNHLCVPIIYMAT